MILPVIFFVVFFTVHFYSARKKKQALKKLSAFLTGKIPKLYFWPAFKGEYQGLKLSIVLIPARKSSPAYLKISLVKSSHFKLTIYKESILSNFGKKIGVVHEVKINDEMFDREFLIFSNRPNEVTAYLNNISVKDSIRELFNNGFNAFFINGKQLLIQKPDYILEKDLEPQSLIAALQKLSLLSRGL